MFLVVTVLSAQNQTVIEKGRQVFDKCSACHGPDGKGVKAGTMFMAPSLRDSVYVKEAEHKLLSLIILKGIKKESNRYVQSMLPLAETLSDEEVAAVITYMTQGYAGKKKVLKAESVAAWRKAASTRSLPYKRSELESLKPTVERVLLNNLNYKLYHGSWERLPDFSRLAPVKEGRIENDIISLEPAGKRIDDYALQFEGDFTVPKAGPYVFALGSDDGSALIIDGEGVIRNDGVHAHKTMKQKIDLDAGEHSLKVQYFERDGDASLSLSVKGAGMASMHLTESKGAGKREIIGLSPRNPGEAIVHRTFLQYAHPRAIAVSYPGGINLCWDAQVMNLSSAWRGAFVDVGGHWEGRGSRSELMGKGLLKTAQGLPLQILNEISEAWVSQSELSLRYEKDKPESDKELIVDIMHPDYKFHGYELDEKRFPTFRYDYRGIEVSEKYEPRKVDEVMALVRRISIRGVPERNLYMRLANTGTLSMGDGRVDIGDGFELILKEVMPVVRNSKGTEELLVEIEGEMDFEVIYRWSEALAFEDE